MAQLPPPGAPARAVERFCVSRSSQTVRQRISLGSMLCMMLGAASLLVACASATPEQPAAPQPSPSPSATVLLATLVPTPTPTPAMTPTATLSIDLEGITLLEETFSSAAGWTTGESASGATTLMDGRLVVAVRQRLTSRLVVSPAEPAGGVLVEAEVEAQVCSPGDEYGLAFRVAPDQSYYRFTVGCDGSARLTRVLPDRSLALVALEPGRAIVPGTEGANRLAVLASGSSIRCFANGQEVITLRDPVLTFGRTGVVVRAGRGGQTTVAFDFFRVLSLSPTATPAR
jgi:hypothetical protein